MNIAWGDHDSYAEGACTMEHRYMRCQCPLCVEDKAKGIYTDQPRCSPRSLGAAMRAVNDRLDDEVRQAMACRIGLVPSILPSADPEVVARVERRVALWVARSVEGDNPAAEACNDATERHSGDLYRWDGWTLCAEDAGSAGGGTWSGQRADGDAAAGNKRRWAYRLGQR